MSRWAPSRFRILLGEIEPAALAALVALMLLSALTESFGIVLLVPILGTLGDGHTQSGVAAWLAWAGLPKTLGPLLAIFIGLVIVRSLVGSARALYGQQFHIRVVDRLRKRAWSALLHCDWRVVSNMRRTDMATLLIRGVDRIGGGVSDLLNALATGATLVGVGAAALAISPIIAGVSAVVGIVVVAAFRRMNLRAERQGKRLGTAFRRLQGEMSENLDALRIIKSFGRENQAVTSILASIQGVRNAERAYLIDHAAAKIVLDVTGAVLVAGLVWISVTQWRSGPETILPLVALSARVIPLLSVLQGSWQNWAHCTPSVDEITHFISTTEDAREPDLVEQAPPVPRQTIAYDAVSVRFAGRVRPALDGITLELPAIGITALAGPSGSGKSTFADVAGGLRAPDEGGMLIDGVVMSDGRRRAWRRSVAYVQQEPVLFTGTIRENLAWAASEASDDQMRHALSRASATFVEELPAGLDTMVGEGGRQLSGGERQRIVLARALLRRPSLLILDEATSALDPDNEAAIALALDRLRSEMAILIICHRGELRNIADRVVKLESGRIVAVEHPAKDCN